MIALPLPRETLPFFPAPKGGEKREEKEQESGEKVLKKEREKAGFRPGRDDDPFPGGNLL